MKKDPPKTQRCTCPTHPAEAQAVAWQFQDREGKWHGFTDERHRQNTIADGSWPVRALYTAPPSAPEAQAVGGGEVRAWMRRWAFDGVDVMALPKDERPHGWQLRPTTEAKCLDDDVPLCTAPVAQGGGEVVAWIAQCELDSLVAMPEGERAHGCVWSRPTGQAGVPLYAAPPSAPVGVEWPLSLLRAGHWREVYIGHRCMRLEVTYEHATWERLMEQVEAALAQQPAAELYRCTACDDHYRIGTPCDCKLQPGHPDFTPATQQPASDPRSTHRVWRGDDWLPCYCEATDDHRIGSEQPASVGVPVDAVREYLDARACYEAATRPPNSHAPAPVLKHDDPDARRLREARVALDNAIITSLSAPQPPAEAQPVGVEALRDLRDRVIPAALRHHASGNGYIEEAQEIVNRALAQQPAAVDDAIAGWIADGDTIPACLIEATRNAIRLEFGNNGTDGYYKRILVRVFTALTAQQGGSDNNRQEDV